MKQTLLLALVLLLGGTAAWGETGKPLRVFIRAGVKTHGPGQHDSPRFLKEWTDLLNQRGAQAEGAMNFPTAEQLAQADVLVMYAANAGDILPEQRGYLGEFLKRGGGMVVIHDAIGSQDPDWLKTIIGGAWRYGHAKFYEGDISFYYLNHDHPITRGAANFDFNDEEYYDLELLPEANILAGTYQPDERNKHDGHVLPSVYDVAPQMWTYEKNNYRAFVSIPGHNATSFNLPHYRAVLLRGIAWAGKRDADSLVSKEELASLQYPAGGPTAPDKAVEKIKVAPDFNIRLVAAEPLIEKPISLDWDAQGRLWVAETPEYPFRKDRARAPYDRISILEDTHHDGRMDKKTVFYEGLDLVTSMVFYRDGVIVSQAPYIYWLRDTQGKGNADKKEMLFRGFGTMDTHAVVSNLRWGMDGWIYATVGYSAGDIYSGDGVKHFGEISSGVIRFKPDGSALEQVSSKDGNTWGMDFAPDGEIFFSQANGNHINHVVMPESALARGRVGNAANFLTIEDHNRSYPLMSWKNQAYVQIDWVGNFTAASGCCIYDGGAWPEKYNYTHYVAEPTVNLVHQDFITPKGVSYVASKEPTRAESEFVASTDLWFRPIHQRVGPDGALYILDFYNQAVVHNDTRGPRHDPQSNAAIRPDRDHFFGRIWRVQHNEAKKLALPELNVAKPAGLVKALEHPNEWVRLTAMRLLLERNQTDVAPGLEKLAKSERASTVARIHALYALGNLGERTQVKEQSLLASVINSGNAELRKAALQIAATWTAANAHPETKLARAVLGHVEDANPRARLEALIALQSLSLDAPAIQTVTASYPGLSDAWLRSAFVGIAARDPQAFIAVAMNATNATGYDTLVGRLAAQIGDQQDAAAAARLVELAAAKPAAADGLKQVALENLTRELKAEIIPAWSPELQQALRTLLASTNGELATLSLPLAARWDKGGVLAGEVNALVKQLAVKLNDVTQPDDRRAQLAGSLLAVRQLDAGIMPSVAGILGSASSPALQRRVIEALGNLTEPGVGKLLTGVYPRLTPELQDAALNQLFKRSDWSLTLLDTIQAGEINLATLSPVAINRLRTHSNATVAERANKIIDTIRGPEAKEKNELIAKFTPLVTQPGDPERGRQLFTQNCAVCHRFNGQGKNVAPDLTGMGAHGAAELIIHVLDPNREVEPNYYAYSIETLDGEIYDGVIARENKSSMTLRNAAGDVEIKLQNIKSRRNTGRSLMPNGFETLGGEVLRDILAYLCAGESNFRILDLRSAFTSNSGKGLWATEENAEDSLQFKKFGLVKAGEVPFEIVNPLKVVTGKNVIVLKGGSGFAKTEPQKVEIQNVNLKAAKLHFLGGVGGWAYPCGGETSKNLPVAKVTIHFADQQMEEIILKNGQEFADWNGATEVPGSKAVAELVKRGQVRWFTKALQHQAVIQSITLESFDNDVAPTFVAITAETGSGTAPTTAKVAPAPVGFKWEPGTTRVLIVGGGSSHDFKRWFNEADSATLAGMNKVSVNYTEKLAEVLPALKEVEVLYWTSNQPMMDEALQKGIFDFANAGHGLLLVHPALWYNWQNWPEYNRVLVGGGAQEHDKYGEFEVTVKKPGHPVMAGVPGTFKITDELYHVEIDQQGTPIEVLAEGKNLATGKTYPVVWIVKHPHGRIVCLTLGHDAQAHELGAYKTMLQNGVKWAAGK